MASKDLSLAEQPVLQLVADLEQAGAMDAVSLTLDTADPMPFDSWYAFGRFLGRIDRSARWWIGDWLNYGEAVFGQEASQAVESTTGERWDEAERVTGLAHDTLLNICRICTLVPKSRRRAELAFSMHEPVAALSPDEQTYWLQRAIDEGWKRSELREEIRLANDPSAIRDDGHEPGGSGGSPGLSLPERVEAAARLIYHQGQPQRSGDVLVPGEAWQHLVTALGEE